MQSPQARQAQRHRNLYRIAGTPSRGVKLVRNVALGVERAAQQIEHRKPVAVAGNGLAVD